MNNFVEFNELKIGKRVTSTIRDGRVYVKKKGDSSWSFVSDLMYDKSSFDIISCLGISHTECSVVPNSDDSYSYVVIDHGVIRFYSFEDKLPVMLHECPMLQNGYFFVLVGKKLFYFAKKKFKSLRKEEIFVRNEKRNNIFIYCIFSLLNMLGFKFDMRSYDTDYSTDRMVLLEQHSEKIEDDYICVVDLETQKAESISVGDGKFVDSYYDEDSKSVVFIGTRLVYEVQLKDDSNTKVVKSSHNFGRDDVLSFYLKSVKTRSVYDAETLGCALFKDGFKTIVSVSDNENKSSIIFDKNIAKFFVDRENFYFLYEGEDKYINLLVVSRSDINKRNTYSAYLGRSIENVTNVGVNFGSKPIYDLWIFENIRCIRVNFSQSKILKDKFLNSRSFIKLALKPEVPTVGTVFMCQDGYLNLITKSFLHFFRKTK